MPATTADFTTFDDTDQPLNTQWVVMARCLQSLGPLFESKIATGTEPADILHGLYMGIDAQSTTRKDWRFKVSTTNTFDVDENTGTDASPVWVQRLTLPSGVSSTVTTDGQGVEISGGQISLELDSTTLSKSATGLKVATGGITNTEVSASAAIAYSKLALTASVVNADIGAAAAIAYSKLALTGSVVNADIGAAAAIAYSKLALTASVVNADIGAAAAIAYSKLALSGSIVNADVNASAAIAYSKLSLAASIVNADISGSAAIAYSKLNLATSILNADINASAAIAYSKLALTGSILNADVNASAAIAYSKLALTGTILNADISASAAIAYSKLALTGGIVNADVNAAAAIAYSKLNLATSIVNADIGAAAAIAYSKLNLATSILNADVNASAAIALSKLAALTASRVPVLDGSGFLTASSVTSTTLGYLDATSSIQTQINALSAGTGDFVYLNTYSPSAAASVDITSQLSATYDAYLIHLLQLVPATDGVSLKVRTDTSNGASFDSGSGNYSYTVQDQQNTAGVFNNAVTTSISLTSTSNVIGSASSEGISGLIFLVSRGSASRFPLFVWLAAYQDTSTNLRFAVGGGSRDSAAAIDAVQLLFSSGNITSGTVRIYGITTS